MLRFWATLAAILALAVAGCGGDDNGGGGDNTPDNKSEAAGKCLDEAKKIEDDSARDTAEEACRSVESGNQDEVRDKAKQQCLDAAKQVPDEASRQKAEQACEDIK